MTDAETLRRAAAILRKRSHKPKAFVLNALCGLLDSVAADIDQERPMNAPSAADCERLNRAALDAAYNQGRATPPEAFRR